MTDESCTECDGEKWICPQTCDDYIKLDALCEPCEACSGAVPCTKCNHPTLKLKPCVYSQDILCVGMDCRPHPCQDFLGLDKEHYEKLKAYTAWAMIYHAEDFSKTMMQFSSYRKEQE